jgi:hypothetical protein
MIDPQDRRQFLKILSLGSAGMAWLGHGSSAIAAGIEGSEYDRLTGKLLTDWCEAMLKHQIDAPDDSTRHGALDCPACGFIHGRCWEAVYPLMYMARATGEAKYLDAAIKLYDWSKNVSGDDGRWFNGSGPDPWAGITIFGSIALAEALHDHGDLLDEARRKEWTQRLEQAADGYLSSELTTMTFANINYGFTAVYGFHLIGGMLKKPKLVARSHEFAKQVKDFLTEPNKLIFGEGKPTNLRSPRGCLPVDIGYNVEESLNGVALYAVEENDLELLELLTKSMNSHLEFMLPDGAWDNSFGTRQAKWSYWGSRTSDGCQPAFSLMADRNPAFATAALRNAQLLESCTANGLLHGGPHYVSHGIKPCIHHTFSHAKVMAFVQDRKAQLPVVHGDAALPRETADGVKEFPEIGVWLAARGPWRATVSACDRLYRPKGGLAIQQATGGSLAVLHHMKVGPLLSASMPRYIPVEADNMQPQPGPDFPLTTRLESTSDGGWFTNLYDLTASVKANDDGKTVGFEVGTTLRDEKRKPVEDDVSEFMLGYAFDTSGTTITAGSADGSVSKEDTTLVVPIISPSGEEVRQVSDRRIEITKPGGTVVVESSVPLSIKASEKGRIFNMVPGMECVPILVPLPRTEGMKATCRISVTQ